MYDTYNVQSAVCKNPHDMHNTHTRTYLLLGMEMWDEKIGA